MRAASYVRVSTDTQTQEGVSLANQTERIRAYAEYKGMTIVAEIEDAGISGGLNKARKGFIALLDRVQAGDIEVIILYSLERLSRDMLTLLALERLLHEYDVKLHTVEGQVDTSTPDGFMNFAMKAFLGEMERRQIKYRTRSAMQHKMANGNVVGQVPYGNMREGDSLVPVVSEQSVIKEVNRRYQLGERLSEITAYLNQTGTLTRARNPWKPQQVKRLITDYQASWKKANTRISAATRNFIGAIA